MRAILIEAFRCEVAEIEIGGPDEQMRKLLGCTALRLVPLDEANHLVVDDAGLLVDGQAFWKFKDRPHIIGGTAVVVGADTLTSLATDTDLSAVELRQNIEWLRVRYTGMKVLSQEEVDTEQGPGLQVVYVPGFEPLPEPEPPAPEPAPEPHKPPEYPFWTITQEKDGYKAHRLVVTESGTRHSGISLENVDLDTLRGMLPAGLNVLPRQPTDDPALVESWM